MTRQTVLRWFRAGCRLAALGGLLAPLSALGAPAASQAWHPRDLPGTRFFVESTDGLVVVDCDEPCEALAGRPPAVDQAERYCDLEVFPDGCVRRWLDQSGFTPPAGFERSERSRKSGWTKGRDFGQDDYDKPGLVRDCIGGQPCVRGGAGAFQDRSFEIELGQEIGPIEGAVSFAVLVRPVPVPDRDANWFGFAGTQLFQAPGDDRLRLRVGFGTSVPITPPGAVAWGAWQLVEVHRASSGEVQVVIDGVDKTLRGDEGSGPVIEGAAYWRFLFSVSRGFAFPGDFAAVWVHEGALEADDAQRLRRYLEQRYSL